MSQVSLLSQKQYPAINKPFYAVIFVLGLALRDLTLPSPTRRGESHEPGYRKSSQTGNETLSPDGESKAWGGERPHPALSYEEREAENPKYPKQGMPSFAQPIIFVVQNRLNALGYCNP